MNLIMNLPKLSYYKILISTFFFPLAVGFHGHLSMSQSPLFLTVLPEQADNGSFNIPTLLSSGNL